MSWKVPLLLALVGVGAALLATQIALWVWCWTHKRRLSWVKRAMAVVPVLTTWITWRAGARVYPVLWFVFVAAYAVLRALVPQ